MALKKSSQALVGTSPADSANKTDSHSKRDAEAQRRKARTLAKQQQASERIASASAELATGVAQAAAARDQLSTAMCEIAAGAEESCIASLESLAAVNQIAGRIQRQAELSAESCKKAEMLQIQIDNTANEIGDLVINVKQASDQQNASVVLMTDLEQQASNINEAVKQVMRIADQTNLLALNAAIEAGRAGKHGKGFAVVADTVRSLAETSAQNAGGIADLVEIVQDKSRSVGGKVKSMAQTALAEVETGQKVTDQLAVIKTDMNAIYEGATELGSAAEEMNAAAMEVQKGSEAIATAAEEQSSAAEEVVGTLAEQGVAFDGAEQASQDLEVLADDLKNNTDMTKASEEVAAAAEELSAAVEEVSRSAQEINIAIDQISRGTEQAAAATEQAVAGISQIERRVKATEDISSNAVEKCANMAQLLETNKQSVTEMVESINEALEAGRVNLTALEEIETNMRSIDKITDAIATVSIKTSMLAVNGAIEAARAGEYGKGFAVVSGDIQNLASDSAENIDQIKDLVRKIQDQATRVKNDLNTIAINTQQQAEKAKQSTSNLQAVVAAVNVIVEENQEIQQAAVEVVAGVTQAKKGMEQIAAASEQASSNAQEAATASQQQSQGAEELAAAIEEIAAIADELQSA